MKTCTVIASILLPTIMFGGGRDLIVQPEISIKVVGVCYSYDKITWFTNQGHRVTWEQNKKAAVDSIESKSRKDLNQSVSLDTQTSVDTSLVPGAGGFASVKSHHELKTHTMMSRQKTKLQQSKLNQAITKNAEITAEEWMGGSGSDWNLYIDLELKNSTTNELLYQHSGEESKCAYLNARVVRMDGKEVMVKLPVNQEIHLMPNGTQKIYLKVNEKNAKLRKTLLGLEILDKLASNVSVEMDSSFPLQVIGDGRKNILSRKERRMTLLISCDFGAMRNRFPVKVAMVNQGKSVSYREAFEALSDEFKEDYPEGFVTFSEDGSLASISGRTFGQVGEKDSIVLAKIDGVYKDKLTQNDLRRMPSRGNEKCEVVFECKRICDIVDMPYGYPGTVLSNCVDSVKQLKGSAHSLTADQKYALGMAYNFWGENVEAIKWFSKLSANDFDQLTLTSDDKAILFDIALAVKDAEAIRIMAKNLGKPHNEKKLYEDSLVIDDPVVFQSLVDSGFVSPFEDGLILAVAASKGATNVLDWVLGKCPGNQRENKNVNEKMWNKGYTPLMYAAINGKLDACRILIMNGADINEWAKMEDVKGKKHWYDICCDSSFNTHEETRNYINSERELLAISDSRFGKTVRGWPKGVSPEKIIRWVGSGVDPNAYLGCRWHLMSWAVAYKDVPTVKYLIAHGADISDDFSSHPVTGYTPLMLAAETCDLELFDMIAKKGVDLMAVERTTGMTALHYAIKNNHTNIIRRILGYKGLRTQMGASYGKNESDLACSSALKTYTEANLIVPDDWHDMGVYQYIAYYLKDEDLLNQLLGKGACDAQDDDGYTPLMCAAYAGNIHAVKVLLNKNVNRDVRTKSIFGGGSSAVDFANENNRKDVMVLFGAQ